jgi:enolase
MADILAVIDADIGQAIQAGLHIFDNNTRSLSTASQSSKEEIEGGRVSDFSSAREAAQDLRRAVNESLADVKLWGGDFPYERALASLQCWKF